MWAQNHTTDVDDFTLGVIGYELMNGERLLYGKNSKRIKRKN